MAKKVYNLIILDRSGSMESIRQATLGGINETLGSIRAAARSTDMEQLVTLMPFCGCSMRDLFHNVPIDRVKPLTERDYQPCCTTPLYDAIGTACTCLRKEIENARETDTAAVSVTIITDGYENSSREWTGHAVKTLIESLRAKGWLFAYIGANQDTAKVSFELSINNHMSFRANEEDTKAMFEKERQSRSRWYSTVRKSKSVEDMSECNSGYFAD